uniref:Uncharacterized protein n=1 Tax=Sphaerodactylus townsendi TaxID=933632 RepID=A0ACB8EDB2_9SAUR
MCHKDLYNMFRDRARCSSICWDSNIPQSILSGEADLGSMEGRRQEAVKRCIHVHYALMLELKRDWERLAHRKKVDVSHYKFMYMNQLALPVHPRLRVVPAFSEGTVSLQTQSCFQSTWHSNAQHLSLGLLDRLGSEALFPPKQSPLQVCIDFCPWR